MFMGFSGVILDSLYVDNSSAFWLFHPIKKRSTTENGFVHELPASNDIFDLTKKTDICAHKMNCLMHNKQVCILEKRLFRTN